MIYEYARVSDKRKQDLEAQIQELKEHGAEVIYKEKISAKNTDRPEFQKLILLYS